MQGNNNSYIEKLVDTPTERFSMRDLMSRLFLRPKLFLFAMLVPPIVAVLLNAMVPVDWIASTKILIRYSGSDTGLLKDLVPDTRLGLSGTTSAELIKSSPVIEKTIQEVGITSEDVYRKPSSVISNILTGFFSSQDEPETAGADKQSEIEAIAGEFKASLDSKSKKSGGDKSIEILEKTSQVPEALKLDELISLDVKSFNREKVASMANGLATAFIEEYYNIYSNEAKKQYDYLDELVQKQELELQKIQDMPLANFEVGMVQDSNGIDRGAQESPMINNMAEQLSLTQAELARLGQIYAGSSPQVVRLRNQVSQLKLSINKQEAIEASKQLLERLKSRRYQAANIEKIYSNRLVPITIAEPATTPKPSKSKKIKRLLISAVIGGVLGLMLAICLMVMLNAVDSRIHFTRDVEDILPNSILGSLPLTHKKMRLNDLARIQNNKEVEQTIVQVITKLGHKQDKKANIILVASPTEKDGASFSALSLATIYAKNPHHKTCLIDANFNNADISNALNFGQNKGLSNALLGQEKLISQHKTLSIDVLSAGDIQQRGQLGYYAESAQKLLDEMREEYDHIIIDAGSVLKSNESLIFGAIADEIVLIVTTARTRKGSLQAAINKLNSVNLTVSGILMNKTKNVLPSFIYKNL